MSNWRHLEVDTVNSILSDKKKNALVQKVLLYKVLPVGSSTSFMSEFPPCLPTDVLVSFEAIFLSNLISSVNNCLLRLLNLTALPGRLHNAVRRARRKEEAIANHLSSYASNNKKETRLGSSRAV